MIVGALALLEALTCFYATAVYQRGISIRVFEFLDSRALSESNRRFSLSGYLPKALDPNNARLYDAFITEPILDTFYWIFSLLKASVTSRSQVILGLDHLPLEMGDALTAVVPDPPTSSPPEWHTIRPWTPHLTLAVREITSVSATFILSSSLDARHTTDDEPDPDLTADDPSGADNDTISGSRGIIAEAVSHGLSVDVNGSNWQRVILRIHDHADEAIIVIYGLHPGRQYDIDMALVSGGTMRRQVTTEDAESTTLDSERNDDHHVITAPEPLSTSTSNANEPSPSVPTTSQPVPEERLRTLTHQLTSLHAEQATLQASLKSLRRDANKTTTSLRSEIDGLKRASEKAGIAEGKARQRVRALEDAVRRANDGREQAERLSTADEQELPGLRERQSEAEEMFETVRKEADVVRAERDKREEEERRRKESMKGECAALNQRLERLTVKNERLESSVVPDLEAQLAELQREIEAVERGCFQNGDVLDGLNADPSKAEIQRRRQSHPGTIGRPVGQRTSQPPISPPHFTRHQPRSPSTYRASADLNTPLSYSPGLVHPSGPLHSSSSSISHPGSLGFTHPATPTFPHSTSTMFSQSTSSLLSRSTSSVGSSTLSSKAPPFEPTRNLRVSLSSSGSSGPFPSSGLLSMNNLGSFSPSSTTFSSSGPNSGLSLSGTYSSAQKPAHASHKSFDADGGGSQGRLGKSTTSKRSSGEDPWVPSNS